MLGSLKSELRKLLTVRSTYILVAIVLAMIAFFTYIGTAPVVTQEQIGGEIIETTDEFGNTIAEPDPKNPPQFETKTEYNLPKEKLLYTLQESVPVASLFIAIVVILLMAHEFRHNTITYTLTITNRRSKVLLSKLLVSTAFIVLVTLLSIGVTVLTTYVAVAFKDLSLPAQDYNWAYVIFRHICYVFGYTMIALGIATLVRNLTAAIAAIFILPSLNALGAALLMSRDMEPTKMLPFSALERVGSVASDLTSNVPLDQFGRPDSTQASLLTAAAVVAAYLVGLWVITWLLFARRDAN